jgi:flagellar assembly protein FliH
MDRPAFFRRDFDREAQSQPADPAEAPLTREDIEEAWRNGHEAGLLRGRAEGRAEAEADLQARRAHLATLFAETLQAFIARSEDHEQALEAQVFDFAIAAGEKLLPELIETRAHHRTMVQLRRGLRMALGSRMMAVRISAQDHDILAPEIDELSLRHGLSSRMRLTIDPAFHPGDLRIAWDHGALETSFREIAAGILDLLHHARPAQPPLATEGSSR